MDKFIVSVYDFVESFNQEEELAWFQLSDKWEVCPQFQHHCCFARFEAYHFWREETKQWQLTTSTRHYHLNPVCTKVSGKESFVKIQANLVVSDRLRQLIKDRFDYDLGS